MKIENIFIVTGRNGPDAVTLFTDLPPSLYPYNTKADLILYVSAGKGVEYVRENFPDVSYQVLDNKVTTFI